MIPTVFGLITILLGVWYLRNGTPLTLICIMAILGLFHASAAVILPAIGGSSISPSRLMLLFVLVAVVMRLRTRASLLRDAIAANAALGIFCIYGLISAFVMPHMFAGQISVAPMRPVGLRSLKDTFPLTFSPQNITTGVYLIGTGLAAMAAYVAMRLSKDVMPLVKTAIFIIWVHAITGILGVLLAGTFWDDVVDMVRTGSYSQVRQGTDTYIRIAGLTPEPSVYATFAIPYFIFAVELWLRNIQPRWSGASALVLMAVLVISTSSTAYVSLAGYFALLGARVLLRPGALGAEKLIPLGLVGLSGLILMLGLYAFSEGMAHQFTQMLEQMTIGKSESDSGQQRAFWAKQGLDAFVVSKGLGIGAGSFRSSSLITAVLGSMGVIGIVALALYCANVFLQGALQRRRSVDPVRTAVGDAACWSSLAGLLPLIANAPSPDPGMEFAIMAGISLACRQPALKPLATKKPVIRGWGDALGARRPVQARPRSIAREAPRSGGWRRSSK